MKIKHAVTLTMHAIVLGILVGCGGNEDESSKPIDSLNSARKTLRTADASSSAEPVSVDALLDWAELNYPNLFPPGPLTSSIQYQGFEYRIRAYFDSSGYRYLGVSSEGGIYGLGDFTNGLLQSFGQISDYSAHVRSQACDIYPQICGTSRYERPVLAVRSGYALGVRTDGAVLAWGTGIPNWNQDAAGMGNLIPGTSIRNTGIRAQGVAATETAAFALTSERKLLGWGSIGRVGGLETTTLQTKAEITEAAFPIGIRAIISGGRPLLAVRDDGTLWYSPGVGLWRTEPVIGTEWSALQFAGLPPISFATGTAGLADSEVAIGMDGSVWELKFDLTPVPRPFTDPTTGLPIVGYAYGATARNRPGLPAIKVARCDNVDCLALGTDGTIWTWRRTVSGPGNEIPAQLPSIPAAIDVWVVNFIFGQKYFLLLDATGQLWRLNEVIEASRAGTHRDPVALQGMTEIMALAHDSGTALILRRDGTVSGWGSNFGEVLGQNAPSNSEYVVQVPGVYLK